MRTKYNNGKLRCTHANANTHILIKAHAHAVHILKHIFRLSTIFSVHTILDIFQVRVLAGIILHYLLCVYALCACKCTHTSVYMNACVLTNVNIGVYVHVCLHECTSFTWRLFLIITTGKPPRVCGRWQHLYVYVCVYVCMCVRLM
jgi:hypothetical protein